MTVNDKDLDLVVGGTQEEIDEIIAVFRKHGFEKGQGYEWREYLRKEEEEGEASAKAFAYKVHKGEIKYNEETGTGFWEFK